MRLISDAVSVILALNDGYHCGPEKIFGVYFERAHRRRCNAEFQPAAADAPRNISGGGSLCWFTLMDIVSPSGAMRDYVDGLTYASIQCAQRHQAMP